jgi:hypothetical protein
MVTLPFGEFLGFHPQSPSKFAYGREMGFYFVALDSPDVGFGKPRSLSKFRLRHKPVYPLRSQVLANLHDRDYSHLALLSGTF